MAARTVALLVAPLATALSQPSMEDFKRAVIASHEHISDRELKESAGALFTRSMGWRGSDKAWESEPIVYDVTTLRQFEHVGAPWTQGLEFSADGKLVETSGDYPPGSGSFVRLLDPESGKPQQVISDGLKDEHGKSLFIEGIVERGGHWFATTYEDQLAIEYDKNFQHVASHYYPNVGWGLTLGPGGESFLVTNGSEYVMSLGTKDWQIKDTKVAHCMGKRVKGLNELEMVEDFDGSGPALLGNVINTRLVLALDPKTFACTGVFHLEELENREPLEERGYHVANGIAYNKKTGTFFVTGKNWRSMFEIRVSKPRAGSKRTAAFLPGSPGPGGGSGDSRAMHLLRRYLQYSQPFPDPYEAAP